MALRHHKNIIRNVHGRTLGAVEYKTIFLGQTIGKSIFLQFVMPCNITNFGQNLDIIWAGQYKFENWGKITILKNISNFKIRYNVA